MTTHSPQMFSRLNFEQVQFTYRTLNGASLADDGDFNSMREAVGNNTTRRPSAPRGGSCCSIIDPKHFEKARPSDSAPFGTGLAGRTWERY
jgi:hypothetical protein